MTKSDSLPDNELTEVNDLEVRSVVAGNVKSYMIRDQNVI